LKNYTNGWLILGIALLPYSYEFIGAAFFHRYLDDLEVMIVTIPLFLVEVVIISLIRLICKKRPL